MNGLGGPFVAAVHGRGRPWEGGNIYSMKGSFMVAKPSEKFSKDTVSIASFLTLTLRRDSQPQKTTCAVLHVPILNV